MTGSKDEPLPESTWQIIWELKAAHDEEMRLRDAWVEHVNSTYPSEKGETTAASAYEIATLIVEAHEAGQLGDAHDETPVLAQSYIDAVRKSQDAMSILEAEYAVSHPELLEQLTREPEPPASLGDGA